jgi:hypothetical protein
LQRLVQLAKKFRVFPAFIHFRRKRPGLRGVQLAALGVGEQTIEAPCDVAQMKRDGRNSTRSRVQFGVSERSAPTIEIFASKFKGVKHTALHRWNIGPHSAKPRLW